MQVFDRVILGAGMYGLYAAGQLAKKGYRTLVIEQEKDVFMRGSYINQARLHNGYHYPRSFSTAMKSAGYFERFKRDYADCLNMDFEQVYAISRALSWTNAAQFEKFCGNLNVRCDRIKLEEWFNKSAVEAAFLTTEYSFDAALLGKRLYADAVNAGARFMFGVHPECIKAVKDCYVITLSNSTDIETPFVLNCTYAGTNQIHALAGFEMLPIKYELCEVILCRVPERMRGTGLTVMDGPFFSLMPFGKTGLHSLTTVSHTPHTTSYEQLPNFSCMDMEAGCSRRRAGNCNSCDHHPHTAFADMRQIAGKYLCEDISIEYVDSLYTLKPILKASEIDDSRPTIIQKYNSSPDFYTVFSGKINTMYDLDAIL